MNLFNINRKAYALAPIVPMLMFSAIQAPHQRDFFNIEATTQLDENLATPIYLQTCTAKTIEMSEKLQSLREGLVDLSGMLFQTGFATKSEEDQKVRPYFVTLQGIMEQNLAFEMKRGKIKRVVGIIHTPTPATPLCTEGDISERLVHSSLEQDENRLLTVKARADIIRDFLDFGCTLYVVYPEGGLEKRTDQQKLVYYKALEDYSNNLHDFQLKQSDMDHDMVGASYLFEDDEGREYLFSIKAYQANAPADDNTWSMWFGETSNPEVAKRLTRVREFLRESGGPSFELKPQAKL